MTVKTHIDTKWTNRFNKFWYNNYIFSEARIITVFLFISFLLLIEKFGGMESKLFSYSQNFGINSSIDVLFYIFDALIEHETEKLQQLREKKRLFMASTFIRDQSSFPRMKSFACEMNVAIFLLMLLEFGFNLITVLMEASRIYEEEKKLRKKLRPLVFRNEGIWEQQQHSNRVIDVRMEFLPT